MAGLSATASTAGKTAKKLIAEETARAKRLTAEVQSLREELAAAARAAKGGDTAQEEELQDLRGRVEEERKARQNAEKQAAHVQEQKDNVDAQYRNLLGRVSTIRTTLGERMKADAVSRACPTCWGRYLTLCRKSWHRPSRLSLSWRSKIGP